MLRDAPFIAHSSAPSRPRITAPPLFGALELGWGGDPWGLEGVQEGAGYLGTLPSSPLQIWTLPNWIASSLGLRLLPELWLLPQLYPRCPQLWALSRHLLQPQRAFIHSLESA